MTRIGVRELRQHASRYLERVKAGEVVEVTERGELVALLVPPTPATAARDRLIAAGRLAPATGEFVLPQRGRTPSGDEIASEVLADLRRDRLE
jgi:prevent-host-death family protein